MIHLAKHLGFCSGVKYAIEIAKKNKSNNQKVFILGNLIHNELAIEELKEEGIQSITIDKISELGKNDVLVLKAHGTEKEIIDFLKDKGISYVDAVCPVVKKVHTIIESIKPDVDIYIFGDSNHDEVKALKSVAENQIRNVNVITEKEKINFNKKSVVVFQTTITESKFLDVKKYIDEMNSIKDNFVVYHNTICYNTKARQDEIRMLAKSTELCLVLGSKSSANTNVLFREAKKVNNNTYLISSFPEVQKINKNVKNVSICSGASTPSSLIQEVISYMSEEVKNQDINSMEDVMNNLDSQGQATPGSVVKCKIVRVGEDCLYVSEENAKTESKISIEDIGSNDLSKYKENQEIEVVYKGKDRHVKKYSIKEMAELESARREIKNALEKGVFKTSFSKYDDKYFYGKLGRGDWAYKVIAPVDEVIFSKKKTNPGKFVKKEFTLKVIPNPENSDKNKNVIFASLKEIVLEKRAQKDAEFINSINVDDILKGKVVSILKNGIVVDINGYSAFVHSSQLSWKPLKDISKVFKVGETFDFLVLEVNRTTNKAIIGHKELTETPIALAQKKYAVGDVVNGEVIKVLDYGAIVRLDEDVDGLVHISELSNKYLKDANEVIKVGEKVDVKILSFEGNRIKLSIKALNVATSADENKNDSAEKKETKKQQPEQSEWRSDVQSSATIGDLFKDLEK